MTIFNVEIPQETIESAERFLSSKDRFSPSQFISHVLNDEALSSVLKHSEPKSNKSYVRVNGESVAIELAKRLITKHRKEGFISFDRSKNEWTRLQN